MTKQFALHRQETSKDNGGIIVFHPQTQTGSALPGTVSATIHKKDGTSLGSVSADWTGPKITLTIGALEYADNNFARITYTASGSTQQVVRQVPFDVVYSPWGGEILCSYEDLKAQHTDIQGILTKFARENGTEIQEEAAYYAYLAHTEIDGWLRQKSTQEGSTRARAIFERDMLIYCEVQLAASKVFQAITPGQEDHPTEQKRKMFWSNARTHFQSLQFTYDNDEDGVPDSERLNPFMSFPIRRR